jgi:hypothetical protein
VDSRCLPACVPVTSSTSCRMPWTGSCRCFLPSSSCYWSTTSCSSSTYHHTPSCRWQSSSTFVICLLGCHHRCGCSAISMCHAPRASSHHALVASTSSSGPRAPLSTLPPSPLVGGTTGGRTGCGCRPRPTNGWCIRLAHRWPLVLTRSRTPMCTWTMTLCW